MKICQICGGAIDFSSRAKKFCSEECRARYKYMRNRAWLAAHPEKAAEYSRRWREANPERVLKISRDAYRKKCIARIAEEQHEKNSV